jgi:hypothetical protein
MMEKCKYFTRVLKNEMKEEENGGYCLKCNRVIKEITKFYKDILNNALKNSKLREVTDQFFVKIFTEYIEPELEKENERKT